MNKITNTIIVAVFGVGCFVGGTYYATEQFNEKYHATQHDSYGKQQDGGNHRTNSLIFALHEEPYARYNFKQPEKS